MGQRIKYNDALGQHMTPASIAQLVSRELPCPVEIAVDLAVGHGDLLAPLLMRWPQVELHGIDCDAARLAKARDLLAPHGMTLGDGLTATLPVPVATSGFLAVCNPPFLPTAPTVRLERLLARAFPGVTSRHGVRRLEMGFFARALIEASCRGGWVAIILPSAFSSGLQYAPYREALLTHYCVVKAIEIRDGRFRDTEASTVLLLIDTAARPTRKLAISRYDAATDTLTPVYSGPVPLQARLDATYWQAAHLHARGGPTLRAVGAEITRGVRSRAEAARARQRLLHTTDLCRLRGRRITLDNQRGYARDVWAEPGDILLPRTGSRVRWEAVEVASGQAPISDHILRVRAPYGFRGAIRDSFRHPDFPVWLRSVSKGVCATVLTKQELLDMPLFALQPG